MIQTASVCHAHNYTFLTKLIVLTLAALISLYRQGRLKPIQNNPTALAAPARKKAPLKRAGLWMQRVFSR